MVFRPSPPSLVHLRSQGRGRGSWISTSESVQVRRHHGRSSKQPANYRDLLRFKGIVWDLLLRFNETQWNLMRFNWGYWDFMGLNDTWWDFIRWNDRFMGLGGVYCALYTLFIGNGSWDCGRHFMVSTCFNICLLYPLILHLPVPTIQKDMLLALVHCIG